MAPIARKLLANGLSCFISLLSLFSCPLYGGYSNFLHLASRERIRNDVKPKTERE